MPKPLWSRAVLVDSVATITNLRLSTHSPYYLAVTGALTVGNQSPIATTALLCSCKLHWPCSTFACKGLSTSYVIGRVWSTLQNVNSHELQFYLSILSFSSFFWRSQFPVSLIVYIKQGPWSLRLKICPWGHAENNEAKVWQNGHETWKIVQKFVYLQCTFSRRACWWANFES